MSRELAISIDGPTASGKTTLAEGLAAHIGAQVLDTGLTFRATAYAVLRERYVPDENFFGAVVRHEVGERGTPPGRPALVYQGVDITDDLWSTNVEASLPSISANPVWRRCIAVYHQSLLLSAERMIAVGRDCASSIMADATCHVYLTAAHSVRRERRRAQHRTQPSRAVTVNPATAVDHATRAYITERANGLILDTTFLPKAAVARAVLSQLGERR